MILFETFVTIKIGKYKFVFEYEDKDWKLFNTDTDLGEVYDLSKESKYLDILNDLIKAYNNYVTEVGAIEYES